MYYEALAAGAGGDWWHVIILQAPLGATINVTDGDEDIDTVGTGNPMAIPVHNENSTYDITINATGFQWTDQFNTTSVSGGYEFIDIDYGTIHLSFDDDFRSQTLTITDNGSNTGTVDAPSTGNAIDLFVPALGTWFISATIGGKTYDCHTTVSDYAVAKFVRLLMVPNGKTVTPTDDIQTWLWCAEIKDKPYTTLAEVLADEYTLKRVLTNDNANDYLKRSTTWIINEALVPTLSSDNGHIYIPSGQGAYSGRDGWYAFDGDPDTSYSAASSLTDAYIGYVFDDPTIVRKARIGAKSEMTYTLEYSDDGTTWTACSDPVTSHTSSTIFVYVDANVNTPVGAHRYWRIHKHSSTSTYVVCYELQFYPLTSDGLTESELAMTAIGATDYGVETLMSDPTWKAGILASEYVEEILHDRVPVMTSNTSPFGVANQSSVYSGHYAFYAFDSGTSNSFHSEDGMPQWISYHFEHPVKINKVKLKTASVGGPKTSKLQYSTDGGSTWQDYGTNASFVDCPSAYTIYTKIYDENISAQDYRLYVTDSNYASGTYKYLTIEQLQFYGVNTGAVQSWLQAAGIVKPYITIEEVLADKNTLAKLMRDHNAVDYLVTAKGLIEAITNSELAMTYIGLSNYAANSLLGDTEWRKGICNSDYFELVLSHDVPRMTSNTTPSGEAYASSEYVDSTTTYGAWRAFNVAGQSAWYPAGNPNGAWVAYDFGEDVEIYKLKIKPVANTGYPFSTIKVQASADRAFTTSIEITGNIDVSSSIGSFIYVLPNIVGKYRYYRIYIVSSSTTPGVAGINHSDFYGRTDIDETKVKVRGAYNSSVYYKNSGVDVPLTTLVGTEGEVDVTDLANIPGYPGKVRLYTTVADDPDSIGNDYWKDVIIDANTCQIDMVPDGALYFYGYKDDDLEIVSTANGWTPYNTNYSFIDPVENNTYYDINGGSTANKEGGIGCRKTIDDRFNLHQIYIGVTADVNARTGYLASVFNKSLASNWDGTLLSDSLTSGSKTKLSSRNLKGSYPVDFSITGARHSTYGLYTTKHNPAANFFGAANDTVYYIGAGGAHVVFAETNDLGEAVVDFSLYDANEVLVLYSSVAKDPYNLSDDFSKVVTIDGNDIYFMPDGDVLYWYGYVGDDCEVMSTNNWVASGYTFNSPTFNANEVNLAAGSNSYMSGLVTSGIINSGIVKIVSEGTGGAFGCVSRDNSSTRVLGLALNSVNPELASSGECNNFYLEVINWTVSTELKVYSLWLAQHREVANFFSAANDRIYYLDSGTPVYIAETNEYGEAYVNWNYVPEGIITLYSSVAKDPTNLSDPFSKQIDNDGTLDRVYLMPEDPENMLYWYGWMSNNVEELSTTNGYSAESGESFIVPTYELNDVFVTTTIGTQFSGIASKKKLSGTIHGIAHSVTSAGGSPQWCAMIAQYTTKARSSGLTDYAVIATPSGSDGKADLILPNDVYVWFYTNNARSAKLQGFWLEP